MFELISSLISSWVVPTIFLFIVVYGYAKKVKVYDAFVDGAAEGLKVAIQIMPYLVVILVAIAIFRTSGAMEILANRIIGLVIPTSWVHPDIVLLSLIKPLSGGAARGVMLDIFQTHGVDSRIGYMASVIQGSTETTFYVLAVYYGAVNIKNTRHTLPCGLIGEFTGVTVAILLSYAMFHGPHSSAIEKPATKAAAAAQLSTTGTVAQDIATTR
jgi:spore maturation protein B